MQKQNSQTEQQTLIQAAKSTDLRLQKNRMLRALGAPADEAETEAEAEPAAEHQWQDPSEWDPATRQQWDDFMRKSRAFKVFHQPAPPFPTSTERSELSFRIDAIIGHDIAMQSLGDGGNTKSIERELSWQGQFKSWDLWIQQLLRYKALVQFLRYCQFFNEHGQ